MRYLLDTDVCIDALRRRERALAHLAAHDSAQLVIGTPTLGELEVGVHRVSDPGAERRRVDAFVAPFTILPFDEAAARAFGRIRFALRHTPIGPYDTQIASIAIARGLAVITRNAPRPTLIIRARRSSCYGLGFLDRHGACAVTDSPGRCRLR